jgi:hypothetical protein
MKRNLALAAAALMVTGGVAAAPSASASATRCYTYSPTKDSGGSICIAVSGSGLHTNSIEGTYDGLPEETTMWLEVNNKVVQSWPFQASDTHHYFSYGSNRNWASGTVVRTCLSFVYGAGSPCSPTVTIH